MRAALVALPLLAALSTPRLAFAEDGDEPKKEDEAPKKEGEKELHGSQGATSQWLPILLGGLAGVAVGAITGTLANNDNPTAGPVVGVAAGGLAGAGAGAWFIRSLREQDTTVAGTLTGIGLGAGIGALIFVNLEPKDSSGKDRTLETIGKWSALAVLPLMGGIVGHHLAVVWMQPTKKEDAKPGEKSETPSGFIRPTFAPVTTLGKSSGFAFGFEGAF